MTIRPANEAVTEPERQTLGRLVRALVFKSLLETFVVCAVLGITGFRYFNPTIRGEITEADAVSIRGWVCSPLTPQQPIQLELLIDGRLVEIAEAKEVRPEHARSAILRRGEYPFQFSFQRLPAGSYTVQVFAVQKTPGRTLSLVSITRRPQTLTIKALK